MGGKSSKPSGSQTVTNNTVSDPWIGVQPHLKTLYGQAEGLRSQGGPQYFPGQTLQGQSPWQDRALQMTADRAMTGSPVQQAGNENAMATLRGDYLSPDSNPWLKGTYDEGARQLEGSMRGAWGGQDTTTGSSGLQQAALGTSLADLASNVYGGNYQTERGRQATMSALAPSIAAADYQDPAQLGLAGATERDFGQQGINDEINRYNYEQNLPYSNLQNFAGLISGAPGGSSTSTGTQPIYGGGAQGALGGAVGGGILGSMFGSSAAGSSLGLTGPYGAAGGAVLGGLMGK